MWIWKKGEIMKLLLLMILSLLMLAGCSSKESPQIGQTNIIDKNEKKIFIFDSYSKAFSRLEKICNKEEGIIVFVNINEGSYGCIINKK